jgi:hypothetical protein
VRGPGCSKSHHAHHIRSALTAGTGMKPPDWATVCLCSVHHDEGHRAGWATFSEKHRIDLPALAITLAARSPYLKETV